MKKVSNINTLYLRQGTHNDIEILAEMNQELIQDEKSTNPMTYTELHNRMTDFLKQNWKAILLVLDEEIVGYGLYQERVETIDRDLREIYLRQYFIRRQFRGRGLGKEGIKRMNEEFFPESSLIIIDVLESNPEGKRFWESIGFKPYYTNMKVRTKDL